jgi:hypothetical protein
MSDVTIPEKHVSFYRSIVLDRIQELFLEMEAEESELAYKLAAGHPRDTRFTERQSALKCDAVALSKLVSHAMAVWGLTEDECHSEHLQRTRGVLPVAYVLARHEWKERQRAAQPTLSECGNRDSGESQYHLRIAEQKAAERFDSRGVHDHSNGCNLAFCPDRGY